MDIVPIDSNTSLITETDVSFYQDKYTPEYTRKKILIAPTIALVDMEK